MATNKRFVYASVSGKEQTESSTLTIQLATTSANQNDSDLNNNNNSNENTLVGISSSDNNNANNYNRQVVRNNNISSNNRVTTTFATVASSQNSARNLLDCCHHQAATRGLLLSQNDRHHQHLNDSSSSSQTVVLEGDEQQQSSATPPPNYHEIPGIVPSYHGRTSGPPPAYDDVVNPNACPPSYQSLFGQVREARKTSNGVVDLLRQLVLVLIGTIGCTMIIGFLLLIPVTMILVGVLYVNECKAENIPVFLVVGGFVWIIKNILNCYNQFKRDSTTTNRPPPRTRSHQVNSSQSISARQANGVSTTDVLIVSSTSPRLLTNTVNSPTELPNQQNQSQPPNRHHLIDQDNRQHSTQIQITTSPTTRTSQQHTANYIRNPPLIGLTSYKCESILNYFLIVWFLAGCIVVYRIYEPDYDNPLSATYCNRTVYLYAFWFMTSAFIIMGFVLSCLCCLMASSFLSCNHGR